MRVAAEMRGLAARMFADRYGDLAAKRCAQAADAAGGDAGDESPQAAQFAA